MPPIPKPRTSTSPTPPNPLKSHQIRLLALLATAKGPLSRTKMAERLGISSTYLSRALGTDDPSKREAFEKAKEVGYPSLLTLKMVERFVLDIDGVQEVGYEINQVGREALASHQNQAQSA